MKSKAADQESDNDDDLDLDPVDQRRFKNPTLQLSAYYSDEDEEADGKKDADDDDDDLKPKPKGKKVHQNPFSKGKLLDDEEESEQEEDQDIFATRPAATAQEDEDKDAVPLVPFNLRAEEEEGAFDEDGHYQLRRDPMAHHDQWLQDVSDKDIQKAAEAHRRQQEQKKQQKSANVEREESLLFAHIGDESLRKKHLLETLCGQMDAHRAQTVPRLLKEQQKKFKGGKGGESTGSLSMGDVTDIAQTLLELGYMDIYTDSVDKLKLEIKVLADDAEERQREQQRKRAGGDGAGSARAKRQRVLETEGFVDKKPSASVMASPASLATAAEPSNEGQSYYYRFEDGAQEYGPFTADQMRQWQHGGYFANVPEMKCRLGSESSSNKSAWRPLRDFRDFS